MGDEERRLREERPARGTYHLAQVAQPLAARDRDGMKVATPPRGDEGRGIEGGPGAPIAGGVLDQRAARAQLVREQLAPAVAAENNHALSPRFSELRQCQQ